MRTSLLAAVVGVHGFQGTAWTVAGEVGRARGNHHPSISPYGLFRCREGAVQIACGSEGLWRGCAPSSGSTRRPPGSPPTASGSSIPSWSARSSRTRSPAISPDALLERLDRAGVPAGRVRSIDEVYAWDQTRSQGLLVDVEHASLGPLTLPGPPLRFFDDADATSSPVPGTTAARAGPARRPRGARRVRRRLRRPLDASREVGTVTAHGRRREATRCSPTCATAAALVGRADRAAAGARRHGRLPRPARRRPRAQRPRRVRPHRRGAASAAGASPWSRASSGSSAGSIGVRAAERIVDAVERATAEGLPLLGITASGGTRMQEGTPAFLLMADIAAAIASHKAAPACPT